MFVEVSDNKRKGYILGRLHLLHKSYQAEEEINQIQPELNSPPGCTKITLASHNTKGSQ